MVQLHIFSQKPDEGKKYFTFVNQVFLVQRVAVWMLPDNGGHDLCSEEDAEGGGGLGGEETQHRENCDGRLTEI